MKHKRHIEAHFKTEKKNRKPTPILLSPRERKRMIKYKYTRMREIQRPTVKKGRMKTENTKNTDPIYHDYAYILRQSSGRVLKLQINYIPGLPLGNFSG